jgi:predicted enzyme related to lactoylglutathione lyase
LCRREEHFNAEPGRSLRDQVTRPGCDTVVLRETVRLDIPQWGIPGHSYVDTEVGGAIPGGISPLQDGAPLVTFFVGAQDAAATLDAAVAQGGKIIQPATSVPGVTFGLLADPQGQVVGLASADN